MALINFFDSDDKQKRLSHIRNLLALAAADGDLDESELELIYSVGARINLTENELRRIINRPESVPFKVPENFKERITQLYDMVVLMMIDGKIHKNEIALCKITAIKLGFKHQIIDKMTHDVIDMITNNIALEVILSNLERKYA